MDKTMTHVQKARKEYFECSEHKEMLNDGSANQPDLITTHCMYGNITLYPIDMYNYYVSLLKIPCSSSWGIVQLGQCRSHPTGLCGSRPGFQNPGCVWVCRGLCAGHLCLLGSVPSKDSLVPGPQVSPGEGRAAASLHLSFEDKIGSVKIICQYYRKDREMETYGVPVKAHLCWGCLWGQLWGPGYPHLFSCNSHSIPRR